MILLQSIAAYAIVAGAVIYVGREMWEQIAPLRKSSDDSAGSCGSCGGCPAAKAGVKAESDAAVHLRVV